MLATLAAPTSGRGALRRPIRARRWGAALRRASASSRTSCTCIPSCPRARTSTFFAEALRPRPARRLVDAALESAGLARSCRRSRSTGSRAACGSGSRSSARCCIVRAWCCSTSRSPASTIARSAIVADRLRRIAAERRDRGARHPRSRSRRRPGDAVALIRDGRLLSDEPARERPACAPTTARSSLRIKSPRP